MKTANDLEQAVRKGLMWSSLNTLVLRLGGLLVGVFLARILEPERFGVYALAISVQAILMTLADLGLSADLIRSRNPEKIAPTIATLGLASGLLLSLIMFSTAPLAATLLGSPESAGVIAVLAITLLLAGLGVVPYATLSRRFEQHKIFRISIVDFTISTTITLVLIFCGWGVISLAVGRVCAQLSTLFLQYWLAGERPRFGWDRTQIAPVLAFSLPVATANLLSWALLNIDNVAVSRMAGPVALGFYVLAFNISSWPMNALGQAIGAVALPAFARDSAQSKATVIFKQALGLSWVVALPAGVILAVLARPLILFVYGETWLPAVPILQALGMFGAMRAVFDLAASYLTARGATRSVLWVQFAWFVVLIPAVMAGIYWFGLVGAGWAHVVVGVIVACFYAWKLHGAGIEISALWQVIWPPFLAVLPAAIVAWMLAQTQTVALFAVLLGGTGSAAIYALIMFRWTKRRIHHLRAVTAEQAGNNKNQLLQHEN